MGLFSPICLLCHVMFLKKKHGSMRMCIDNRELNKATIRNKYFLPPIVDLIYKVRENHGFRRLIWRPGTISWGLRHQMSLRQFFRRGIVIIIGLTNTPATFIELMNGVFWPYLNSFVIDFMTFWFTSWLWRTMPDTWLLYFIGWEKRSCMSSSQSVSSCLVMWHS